MRIKLFHKLFLIIAGANLLVSMAVFLLVPEYLSRCAALVRGARLLNPEH
jgi:hypothetical protein